MVRIYHIVSSVYFYYILATIKFLDGNISNFQWFMYGYVIWNILIFIYLYNQSNNWDEKYPIKTTNNEYVGTNIYYYNPLTNNIFAWIEKNKKWEKVNDNIKYVLIDNHIEMDLIMALVFSTIYILIYTFILIFS